MISDTTDKKLAKYCETQYRDIPIDRHFLYKLSIFVKIIIQSLFNVSVLISITIELNASRIFSISCKINIKIHFLWIKCLKNIEN